MTELKDLILIGFTGHRNRTISESYLDLTRKRFPNAIWYHGGAAGFDTQVKRYAERYNIPQVIVEPDYEQYGRKVAPLVRNREIVNQVSLLIACYNGRKRGGTFYTINYCRNNHPNMPVIIINPDTQEVHHVKTKHH